VNAGNLFPIAFMDSPQVLNATVTPIPGSGTAPLQVVADLGFRAAYAIDYIDSTGDYVGIYIGTLGFEHLVSILGGGAISRCSCVLPAHSRVSLRSITSSAITDGHLSLVFMGMGWNGSAA
jgi:hypothetical protein